MKALFKVVHPGLCTSIQDAGRHHYQDQGVPVSGAIDQYAYKMSNYLLGNDNVAVIEITMQATFKVMNNATIMITGANLNPTLDGETVPNWCTFPVEKGQTLRFKGAANGLRAYIGVPLGIRSNSILSSQATLVGGHMNEKLKKADIVYFTPNEQELEARKVRSNWIPTYGKKIKVRVLMHIEGNLFDASMMETFLGQTYTVQTGDRMGLRLECNKTIHPMNELDILSEAVSFGTIQIPPNGKPIILLADSQTTGGYPVIANVITVDLWKLAQVPMNGKIQFEAVQLDEAIHLQKEWTELLI